MTKLYEAELYDIVDLLYKFITDHTKLFDTMAAGKMIHTGLDYRADIEKLAKKAKVCYEHPGNEGLLQNGQKISLDNFKTRLFGILENKFITEFPKKVDGDDYQFKRIYDLSFIYLAAYNNFGCLSQIADIFGNNFISRSKAIVDARNEKKAVNESFKRIYNQYN